MRCQFQVASLSTMVQILAVLSCFRTQDSSGLQMLCLLYSSGAAKAPPYRRCQITGSPLSLPKTGPLTSMMRAGLL